MILFLKKIMYMRSILIWILTANCYIDAFFGVIQPVKNSGDNSSLFRCPNLKTFKLACTPFMGLLQNRADQGQTQHNTAAD